MYKLLLALSLILAANNSDAQNWSALDYYQTQILNTTTKQISARPISENLSHQENFVVPLQLPLTPNDCPMSYERQGAYSIQRLASRDGTNCLLHISTTAITMVYRSFVFTSEGEFLVFNSYGEGNMKEKTGARVFFIFPRIRPAPTYSWNHGTKELIVRSASGHDFTFDYHQGTLKSFSGGDLRVDSAVIPTNKGGVEIRAERNLILDAGFKKGGSPITNGKNSSAFQYRQQRCSFMNNIIFKYTESGDAYFKYDDQWLIPFLQDRCPNLGLSNL